MHPTRQRPLVSNGKVVGTKRLVPEIQWVKRLWRHSHPQGECSCQDGLCVSRYHEISGVRNEWRILHPLPAPPPPTHTHTSKVPLTLSTITWNVTQCLIDRHRQAIAGNPFRYLLMELFSIYNVYISMSRINFLVLINSVLIFWVFNCVFLFPAKQYLQ